MKTTLLPEGPAATQQAARLLVAGQVVGIPTETVYGLAANALDDAAVQRIFAAKGRPQDNPLIVHISHPDMLPGVSSRVPKAALALAEAFWPGPLTLVLPKAPGIAQSVNAGLDTVGVRLPAHRAAQAVISACGLPLAAPSANRSGSPSPTTARHVLADMDGRIPLIIDGGPCPVGVESTVLSLAGNTPTILRPGFVTQAMLQAVLGTPVALSASINALASANLVPESPGMKYKHYAPQAEITIVDSNYATFISYLSGFSPQISNAESPPFVLGFEDEDYPPFCKVVTYGQSANAESQAKGLFTALRRLDEQGAHRVLARAPAKGQLGMAVHNRLLRAAGFRKVTP